MTRLQTLAVVVVLSVVPAANGRAVAQAGFSGRWTLDVERSDPLTRGGEPLPEIQMTLEIRGDDVAISRELERNGQRQSLAVTYTTDGKPHDVTGPFGGTRATRARWKKDKLVVSYTLSRNTQRGNFDLDITETWSLSKDGSELEISYLTRMGERTIPRQETYVRSTAGD